MTYENIDTEIKKINNEITELMETRNELQKQRDKIFREEAVKHVGRCFKRGDEYVKIIGVPDDDVWSKYYFPTICLLSSEEYDSEETMPFMYDHDSIEVLNNNNYVEISQDEFNAEFKKRVDEFRTKVITIGDKTCLTCRMYNNPTDFLCLSCSNEYSNYESMENNGI